MRKLSALLALAAALSATSGKAQTDSRVSIAVRRSDLDLQTRAGQRTLNHRIRAAVLDACGEISSIDPKGEKQVRRCRSDVRAQIAVKRAAMASSTREAMAAIASRP